MDSTAAPAIHPTAIVDPAARIGADVRIGPYSIVGPHVELGEGVVLHAHVVVGGRTSIGARTQIFPFASIGLPPQDLKFKGEESRLVIGADNVIREHVTMNPGTEGGGLLTQVGDNCLFMVGSHVAHDCRIGNRVILANNATIAGHVVVEDFAILGGLSAVHQFCRIGRHAMIGGMSAVDQDVIPYGLVMGERAHLSGLNLIGLKRRGYDRAAMRALRAAFDALFEDQGTLAERLAEIAAAHGDVPVVRELVDFVRNDASRGLCHPRPEDRSQDRRAGRDSAGDAGDEG